MDSQAAARSRRRSALRLVAALVTAMLVCCVAGAGAAAAYPVPATIWTIAGNGISCLTPTGRCGDGPIATAAQLTFPNGVAVDSDGNVYIADTFDNKIRKVAPAGAISTIAGDGNACWLGYVELRRRAGRKRRPNSTAVGGGGGRRRTTSTSPTPADHKDPKTDAGRGDLHDRGQRELLRGADLQLRRRARTRPRRSSAFRPGWRSTAPATSTSLTRATQDPQADPRPGRSRRSQATGTLVRRADRRAAATGRTRPRHNSGLRLR